MDIGNGVLVPQSLLARIKASAGKQPTRYARDLLRAVFTVKELAGSSLHGKACNARKDVATKKALDPERLDAVLCKSIMQAPLSPPLLLIRFSSSTYFVLLNSEADARRLFCVFKLSALAG